MSKHNTPNVQLGNGADRRERRFDAGDAIWLIIGLLAACVVGICAAAYMGGN